MIPPRSFLPSILVAFGASLIAAPTPLRAATYDLSASQVGGLLADGAADNLPVFQNYYVGYSTLTSVEERRSFFLFDLSTVTTPIVSADFSLTLPFGGLIFGGGDTTEDFILSGTTVPIATILDPAIDPADAMSAWATFGEPLGLIGGVTFDSAAPPIVPPEGLEIVIPLDPLGVDLINANLGGEVLITGRMLDVTPLDPALEKSELIFGLSDVIPVSPTSYDFPFLSLTEVPEPQSAALAMLASVLGLACRRRR